MIVMKRIPLNHLWLFPLSKGGRSAFGWQIWTPGFHIYSSSGEQTAPRGGAAAGVPTAHRVRTAQHGQLRPACGAVAEWHWPVRAAKMEEEVRGRENVLGVSKADT